MDEIRYYVIDKDNYLLDDDVYIDGKLRGKLVKLQDYWCIEEIETGDMCEGSDYEQGAFENYLSFVGKDF
jgi:hypothetical protein